MMRQFTTALLLLSLCTGLRAQATDPTFDPAYAQKLQQALNQAFTAGSFAGLSVAVRVPGHGLWVGAAGSSMPGQPITPNMRFGLASNSKSFVAALCLRLVDQGLLNLDAPISAYLNITNPNVNPNITLRQMLGHQSGLFDFYNDQSQAETWIANNPDRLWTPEELLATVGPPAFAPGASFSYSNTNFLIAGMLCTAVTGKPLRQLFAEEIAQPLGLSSLAYPAEGDPIFHEPFAMLISGSTPALDTADANAFLSYIGAAGALWCTAADMAKWYQMLFTSDFLSPSSRRELHKTEPWSAYSLGLRARNHAGASLRYHAGAWGYRSYALYDVNTGISVAVLSNRRPSTTATVADRLLEVALQQLPERAVDLSLESIITPHGQHNAELTGLRIRLRNTGATNITQTGLTATLDGAGASLPLMVQLPGNGLLPDEWTDVNIPQFSWPVDETHQLVVSISDQGYTFDNVRSSWFHLHSPEGPAANFPESFSMPTGQLPEQWISHQTSDVLDWEVSPFAGNGGALCRNFFNDGNNGAVHLLDLPPLRKQDGQSAQLTFSYAYASYSGTERDSLEVLVSTDCGESFQSVWKKGRQSLATASNTTSAYKPASAHWVTQTISTPDGSGETAIFRFRTVNGFGNNLWIDNVDVSLLTPVQEITARPGKVYPNPNNGKFILSVDEQVSSGTLLVFNLLGQRVKEFRHLYGQQFELDAGRLPAGAYVYQLTEGKRPVAQGRLLIQ